MRIMCIKLRKVRDAKQSPIPARNFVAARLEKLLYTQIRLEIAHMD